MSDRFLLDTNVISELARPRPAPAVAAFVGSLNEVLVPVIAVYEIESGIRRLPAGKRRKGLEQWLSEWLVPPVNVLSLDGEAVRTAARVEEAARRRGRSIETHDLFVLAIAKVHGLGVATRNVGHFEGHGVTLHDPFEP